MASSSTTPDPRNRDAARERARQLADQHARQDKRSRRLLQFGILALVLVILAVIGVVVAQNRAEQIPEAGPVPASANQWGGTVLTADGIRTGESEVDQRDLGEVPEAPETPDDSAVPPGVEPAGEGEPVPVVIFQDFECVHCADFETENGEALEEAVTSGDITLEYRNLNFLDRATPTQYSSRAAAAAYEVGNQVSTEQYLAFVEEVFSHQGSGGLDDEQLVEIAATHGADIATALEENTWRPMVNVVSQESLANGVSGTPTVFIDGERLGNEAFQDALDEALADQK
ncbi:disulfide bond formation protein DsbA [Kocuria sp. CNJ-770]|uniref:DsbA family protein n=1 Tax=Kocuria sp. CNJ-770 TaxID=1904964 RepID=UPI0009605AE0|nr:DsbA family protein [Kocuria sp. CNJ-770]OLT09383.1 disulfide bond formation protein DsbA [Kocuria sp. CNJ-770]